MYAHGAHCNTVHEAGPEECPPHVDRPVTDPVNRLAFNDGTIRIGHGVNIVSIIGANVVSRWADMLAPDEAEALGRALIEQANYARTTQPGEGAP